MNAVARFTVASLKANRVRTIVTVAGVALAAALLTAVLTSYTSLTHYLYESEAALSGTWMAMAQEEDSPQLWEDVGRAEDASGVTAVATLQDVGFASLTSEQQRMFGKYLTVLSAGGDVETVCAVRPSEGRMPSAPGEVLLWDAWRQQGVDLGDTIELLIGQREAIAIDSAAGASEDGIEDLADFGALKTGDRLDSSIGYLDPEVDGGSFEERLVDVQDRAFTVVGFYDHSSYGLVTGMGTSAVTVDPEAAGMVSAYVALDGASTQKRVVERVQELFPDSSVTPHTAMLRYLGIAGDGSIWGTFFGIAAVLAVVIVAACMSLIYNAFAISVAERTNQFGLLSSVGATRRQLRGSVALEALLVACAGIPLGILVGVGGCAVTFACLGPGIALVLGDAGVPFSVSVSPWVLLFAVALTLVTVLLSAFVPAVRASRMNIIDALRWTKGGRVSKKGARLAARHTDAGKLWWHGGGFARLFGVGGSLARLGRKRGATKGRTASVSLALAIILLMTAGSLTTFLERLTDAADGGPEYDIELSVYAADVHQSTLGGHTDPALLAELDSIYAAPAQKAPVSLVDWVVYSDMPALIPSDMAGDMSVDTRNGCGGLTKGGDVGSFVNVTFLDDEAFAAYARDAGVDPAGYLDPDHPRAIAVGTVYGNDGSRYQVNELLRRPGPVELCLGGTYRDQPVYMFSFETNIDAAVDVRTIEFLPEIWDGSDSSMYGSGLDDPELDLATLTVDVAALTDRAPVVSQGGGRLQLVMARSALPAFAGATVSAFTAGGYDVTEGSSTQATAAIDDAVEARIAEVGAMDFGYHTNDYAAMQEGNRMLATIVNVFCLLFTVILALIAMANVFNTVTNGLILRRREFAVMRSIGLSGRQFCRMIACECASFGIAGLVPGLLVSAVVSYLLYRMVAQSLSGLAFALPWFYVVLAVALTAVTMVASVAYGMHRCKADSVVGALRSDNI